MFSLKEDLVRGGSSEEGEAPVAAHLAVDEVLVDGRQLVRERIVEIVDDFGVALHNCSPEKWLYAGSADVQVH